MRDVGLDDAAGFRRTRLLHVITGLRRGGAELALLRLVEATDRARFDVLVASLSTGGEVAGRITAAGVPVHDLHMRSVADAPAVTLRLARLLRHERIDVVQTWMYHSDLVGGAAATLSRIPVVWGLRMGAVTAERATTRAVVAVNARLSRRLPTAIVACSASVAAEHVARGYPSARIVVIPNGYAPGGRDHDARARLRAALGMPADATAIGRVGRWHPMKDYPGFLAAAGPLLRDMPSLHLVLVGDGVDLANPEVLRLRAQAPDPERIHVLGPREDMASVYSSLDVLCSSSSSGEGFPNVVAEAMLAEVPVVATDVGESASIIGDTGVVVPPGAPDLLRAALEAAVRQTAEERAAAGRRARARVEDCFGVARMASAYAELHAAIAGAGTGPRRRDR